MSLRAARLGGGPAARAWAAVSVETFRPVEIKHAICVRSFHEMRSFHVVAACGIAAPRTGHVRGFRVARPPLS